MVAVFVYLSSLLDFFNPARLISSEKMASYPIGFRVAQAVGISGAAWLAGRWLYHNYRPSSNAQLAGNIAALSTITTPALVKSQKEDNPPIGLLAKQWRNVYENGKSKNQPVAVGVTSAFIYLAWSVRSGSPLFQKAPISRSVLFSAAAALTMSIVPFTFVAMSGTNNKLLEKSESTKEASDADTVDLVERWTTLNQIRGLLPLIGALCGMLGTLL